jgi:hypothetical protein
VNFKELQDAIRSIWVLPASGLPSAKVYIARQDVPPPAPPYITIELGDSKMLGSVDEVKKEFDANAPAGQEFTLTAQGPRELLVTLEAFSASAAAIDAEADARGLLSKVRAALGLPTIRPALNALSIAVMKPGEIRWVPGIQKAAWEGRAIMETTLNVVETAQAKTGYIQNVNGTRTIDAVSSPYSIVIED